MRNPFRKRGVQNVACQKMRRVLYYLCCRITQVRFNWCSRRERLHLKRKNMNMTEHEKLHALGIAHSHGETEHTEPHDHSHSHGRASSRPF